MYMGTCFGKGDLTNFVMVILVTLTQTFSVKRNIFLVLMEMGKGSEEEQNRW